MQVLIGLCALAAGVFFTVCEVIGAKEYQLQQQGQWNYIVVSIVGIAAVLPFLPACSGLAWAVKKRGTSVGLAVVSLAAIAIVLGSALARTGGSTDDAQRDRERAEQARVVAIETQKEAKTQLEDAQRIYNRECNDVRGKTAVGQNCIAATERRDAIQARLDKARDILLRTSPSNDDGETRRVAAIISVWVAVTEDQVRTWRPMAIPVTVSLLAMLFTSLGVGLMTAPRIFAGITKKSIQPEPKPEPLPTPSMSVAHLAKILPMKRPEPKRKTGNVKQFLLTCAAPAEGERVPMKALLTRYREWCAASEFEPLSLGGFMDAIDGACKLAGIEIEAEGSTVYCLDVRLSA